MRDSGTSSAQTAGCGHTKIQQGLYRISGYRVAGEHSRATGYRVLPALECCRFRSIPASNPVLTAFTCTENYRFLSVAGPRVLPVLECTSFKSSAGNRFTCTENYWFLSVAGPRVLPVPECTSLKPSSDHRFTCYRELPVTEGCRFRSLAGYNDLRVTS